MNRIKQTACLLLVSGTIISALFLPAGCALPYNGEKLFFREGCSQCHSYKGRGGRMGPDLSAVTNIRSDSWIENYLHDPRKMNPLSRMPSFKHLSRSKRKAIVAFLKN